MPTLTLTDDQVRYIRRALVHDGSTQASSILSALDVATPRPTTARCPDTQWDGMVGFAASHQCAALLRSEDALYDHLRMFHRYPEEDAGSSAARSWEER